MKHLTLLIFIGITIMSCNLSTKNKSNDAMAQGGVVQKSLDGIDSATAVKWIAAFEKNAATYKLTTLNFLIKKDTLQKLVGLLVNEKADGMRIYFVGDPKNPAAISILLVSTRDSSLEGFHHDYYTHSDTAPLIKLNLNGFTGYTAAQSPGAMLYTTCDTCKDDTSCDFANNPHYLTRAVAEGMVQSYNQPAPNGTQQTYAEWYDLDMLKAFVADPNCDGMRIYFARHLKNDGNPLYVFRQCFVVTNTENRTNNNIYKDYFSCTTLKSYFTQSVKQHPNWYAIPRSPGQDNGELCPTSCN